MNNEVINRHKRRWYEGETDSESSLNQAIENFNELLDIAGVKATFVLTPFNNKIYISARSIDEINVQIIMERLGGGGHMNMAGAQLNDMSPESAIEVIKDTINQMLQECAI